MAEPDSAALVACAHPRCERPSDLNPPYCCVPCEVNHGNPGPEHLHSVTCERKHAKASLPTAGNAGYASTGGGHDE